MDTLRMLEEMQPQFSTLLGVKFLSAEPERVRAEMEVREDLCTRPAVLHGGAMMAMADTLGACATVINLPEGAGTTTIESKTNFLASAPVGTKVIGDCVALHRGKSTMVWQTRITSQGGRLLGIVTQTQMVLRRAGS